MAAAAPDYTQRFSDKVDNYVAYRPTYPDDLFKELREQFPNIAKPGAVIADVGSGTGILSAQLIENFPEAKVYAVEPNGPMREAAEKALAAQTKTGQFHSVSATAEACTLEDKSCDLIIAGTSAHWFNFETTAKEWRRIIKPGGGVVIAWNMRLGSPTGIPTKEEPNDLMVSYEKLNEELPKLTDDRKVRHAMRDKIGIFFGPEGFQTRQYPFSHFVDLPEFQGRFLSSSYAPKKTDDNYQSVLEKLKEMFDRNVKDGKVEYQYETLALIGTAD